MRWIVEGANPETGRELKREVEAGSVEDAELLAHAKGMLVSKVQPAPVEALPYETPGPQGLPMKPVPTVMGPEFICPNINCGYRGPSSRQKRGSEALGFLLLLFGLVPGILYLVMCVGHKDSCPKCGNVVKL